MNGQDIHEQARLLLTKAGQDALVVTSHGIHGENFSDSIYGFHAQQAVEKAIKAVLWIRRGEVPAFTHDLGRLWVALASDRPGFPLSSETLTRLTPYAVVYRYDIEDECEPMPVSEMQSAVGLVLAWAQIILETSNPTPPL